MKKVVEQGEVQEAKTAQPAQNPVTPQAEQETAAQRDDQLRLSGVIGYLEGKVKEAEAQVRTKEQELHYVQEIVQAFFNKLARVVDTSALGNLNSTDYELSVEVEPKTNKVKLIKAV